MRFSDFSQARRLVFREPTFEAVSMAMLTLVGVTRVLFGMVNTLLARLRIGAPLTLVALLLSSSSGTAAQDTSVEVPFTFEHNEILVQVNVMGKGPFNMLLDTGTTPSSIDIELARELGLTLQGKGHAAAGAGTERNVSYGTTVPDVEVRGVKVERLEAGAIDLSKLGTALGTTLHGVLGYSFLKDRAIQIDYPRKIVRFLPLSAPPAAAGATAVVLPFQLRDDEPIIQATVNGVRVTSVIDTGWGGYVALTPDTVDRLGLATDATRGGAAAGVGYNGRSESRTGTIASLGVGSLSIEHPVTTFRPRGTGFDRRPFDISLGNAFLKDFVVTFDYRRKVVTLAR